MGFRIPNLTKFGYNGVDEYRGQSARSILYQLEITLSDAQAHFGMVFCPKLNRALTKLRHGRGSSRSMIDPMLPKKKIPSRVGCRTGKLPDHVQREASRIMTHH